MRLALKVIQDLEHYISSWETDKPREVSRGVVGRLENAVKLLLTGLT